MQFAWVSRALNILARVGTCAGTFFVQCFAWSAWAMYHLPGLVLVLVRPLCSASTCLTVFMFVLCVSRKTVCTVLVSLVHCFAWSVRTMYLLAHVCTCTGTPCVVGQHGRCTHLPMSVLYLRVRACILVQCFVMGNPSHVRVLVFGLSRCNCSATPTDMDSLLVMSRNGFYVRCIRAGCLYLTCRGAIVCLPVCTAKREGWQPRLIYTM